VKSEQKMSAQVTPQVTPQRGRQSPERSPGRRQSHGRSPPGRSPGQPPGQPRDTRSPLQSRASRPGRFFEVKESAAQKRREELMEEDYTEVRPGDEWEVLNQSGRQSHAPPTAGEQVWGRYRGGAGRHNYWYQAKVAKVHADGTLSLRYADGAQKH
jgi:hypothetical protein